LAKKGDKEAAMEGYEKIIREAKDPAILEKAYYDKGVLHQQQQQLDESILSWMESLKLDPNDQQARENLQKALKEKQQQQQQQEKDQKEQDKKENKEDKDQQKPKPQNSKLNQKQVEQLLKALEQKEKEVQKKMQQRSGSPSRPEKDW
jgi:Ca-activated chloride channel family protein